MEKSDVIYVDTNSILVSTKHNKLARIKCPFHVVAIRNVDDILIGQLKTVWAVYPSTGHRLLYLIDNKLFVYNHFHLSI